MYVLWWHGVDEIVYAFFRGDRNKGIRRVVRVLIGVGALHIHSLGRCQVSCVCVSDILIGFFPVALYATWND